MTDVSELLDLAEADLPDIPFNEAAIEGRELEYVQEADPQRAPLLRRSVRGTYGDAARRARPGAEEVLLTTSCTAALELSAMLLDLAPGDTVIVPSFTFTTTALAFARQGAGLVFCDIERRTLGLDPEHLATLLDENVRAVVVVHYAGIACDIEGIRAVLADWPDVDADRGQRARAVRQLAGPAPGQLRPVRRAELPRDQELRLRRGRRPAAERAPGRRPGPGALRQGHQPPGVHAGPGRQVHLEGHRLVLRSRRRPCGVPARPSSSSARSSRPSDAPCTSTTRGQLAPLRRRARVRADGDPGRERVGVPHVLRAAAGPGPPQRRAGVDGEDGGARRPSTTCHCTARTPAGRSRFVRRTARSPTTSAGGCCGCRSTTT